MNKWEWSEKYSVGVSSLDNQHRKLFELINQLIPLMDEDVSESQKRKVTKNILEKLSEYTIHHFEFEEALFNKFGFALSEEHQESHQKIYDNVTSMLEQFFENQTLKIEYIYHVLIDWIEEHVLSEDKKYVDFFKEKNLS